MKHNMKRSLALTLAICMIVVLVPHISYATVLQDNVAKTRAAATQGFVLLKNQASALPLTGDDRVVVLGNRSFFNDSMTTGFLKSGGGSGDVYGSPVTDIYQGLANLADQGRIQLFRDNEQSYRTHLSLNKLIPNEKSYSDEDIKALAAANDTVVVTIGRSSSELFDHKDVKGDFYLSDQETKLLSQIQRANFKKVIALVNIGTPMDLRWIDQYDIDAAMITWFPGAEGGNAIADVLIGDVVPSGKLSMTIAKTYNDYPTYGTYHESRDYVNYYEDIYLGYRYFETFKKYDRVLYPFGYGLGYTTFELSNASMRVVGDEIEVAVQVTNNGQYEGREVAQVYYRAPQGKLGNPGLELSAFAKTRTLQPGESETLTMRYAIDDMKSFDDLGKIQRSAFILERGNYDVFVGNSSASARDNRLGSYNNPSDKIVEQLSQQLTSNLLSKRLTATGEYESLLTQAVTTGSSITTSSGILIVQAENYDDKYDFVTTESFTSGDYTGTSLAKMTDFANTWATYSVDVPLAGDYKLSLRAANGFSEIKDMLDIDVDGVTQPNVVVNMPRTGWGILKSQWHNYIDVPGVDIHLAKGKNVITLKSKNHGFANIDYFMLTKTDSGLEPALPYQAPTSIQPLSAVKNGDISLDAFIAQMNNFELAELLGGKLGTLAGNTGGIGGSEKFGIPAVQTADGPAGIRLTSGGTAWPVATLMACSWDIDLLETYGNSIADEAIFNNVDIWLAPGMNLQRDPLCARNFEYYSEDPFLTAQMAKAIVRSVEAKGVLVTVKHFIANNKETNRNASDSRISERALREMYLRIFEETIKETKPSAVMTSYNYVNGYETASNYELLTNILREEWGYQGVVMTDWFNQSSHTEEVFAGNDVKMPFGDSLNLLIGIDDERITREHLVRSAKRVLKMIVKTKAVD